MPSGEIDRVEVGLNLGVLTIKGGWKPNDAERDAAWELYVELATRSAVVPLRGGEGLIREALTSLYSLFDTTRGILREYGPVLARPRPAGEYSFGQLAMLVLNFELRPLASRAAGLGSPPTRRAVARRARGLLGARRPTAQRDRADPPAPRRLRR